MQPAPLLFDAVLFDLDGTLVSTDSYWVKAADTGARRAFDELGLDTRRLPGPRDWTRIVGLPLEFGMRALFEDLSDEARHVIQERCVEEESRALAELRRSGGAALFPGARETLAELRGSGLRTAIASNCSAGYLERVFGAGDWSRLVDGALCLDSPGIESKADMLFEHLLRFDTRRAVMVGDRAVDREAAFANGLPHVHVDQGFGDEHEAEGADACVRGLDELVPLLRRRGEALEELVARLSPPPGAVVGIGGAPGSGKSLFARDLARVLGDAKGGETPPRVHVLELETFRRAPDREFDDRGAGAAEREVEAQFDLEALREGILEPHGQRQAVVLPGGEALGPEDVLLLAGTYVEHPRLAPRVDRAVHLSAEKDVLLRRLSGREFPAGAERLAEVRGGALARYAGFARDLGLAERAFDTEIVEHSNPLLPRLAGEGS